MSLLQHLSDSVFLPLPLRPGVSYTGTEYGQLASTIEVLTPNQDESSSLPIEKKGDPLASSVPDRSDSIESRKEKDAGRVKAVEAWKRQEVAGEIEGLRRGLRNYRFTLSIGGMYGIPSSVKHLTSIASRIATFNKQDSLLRVSALILPSSFLKSVIRIG